MTERGRGGASKQSTSTTGAYKVLDSALFARDFLKEDIYELL